MSKTQQWVVSGAVAILLVLAAGWFLLVSPQRAKASDLRSQTATEQSRSAALRTDLAMLTAQSKQLPAKQAELAKFAKHIPSDPALPAMIRALQQAASTAGAVLVSIAPQPVTAYTPGAAPVAPAAAAATAPATPTSPVGASTLQAISLTVKVTGAYVQLEQFVANLEGLSRLFLVNGYTMAPSTVAKAGTTASCTAKACPVDLEVTGQVFIAPALIAPPVPAKVK